MGKLKDKYNKVKSQKVGEVCQCPSCCTEFVKETYNQCFCKTKGGTVCKDKYWNTVTPSKRNNTTRISPRNKQYKNEVILPRIAADMGYPDVNTMLTDVDDYDSMSVTVENCEWCGLRAQFCTCD